MTRRRQTQKARSRGVRSSRKRGRRRGWVRGLVAVVLGASLTVGAVEAFRWAKRSSLLAIVSVEVDGTERASSATIQRMSGITEGTNLLALDIDAARDRVLGHPWVADAAVRVVSIDSVRISITEHVPVALVALGNLYFVDAQGRFFKRLAPSENADVPVVTGLERASVESEDPKALRLLASAIQLVSEWDVDAYGELAEVNVAQARGLTVVLVEDGLTVALGEGDWRSRLTRLAEVRSTLEDKGLTARRIDLTGRRRGNRAVVRLEPVADPNGDV